MDACLLIAEDDLRHAQLLERVFRRRMPIALARSFREATELLVSPTPWLGAVLDVTLPDGSGLDLLDSFRDIEPRAPALVLSGHCDPAFINRAQRRHALYAVKPALMSNLDAFADRTLEHRDTREHDVRTLVAAFGDQFRLTPGERKILAASVRGTSRKDLPRTLGLSEGTIKVQVRTLLRKCGDAEQLGDVVRDIWRAVTA